MTTHEFPKGRCVAGEDCKFPNLWLRPQDKCTKCKKIVHPLCGILNEEGDSYRCPSCADSDSDKKISTATRVTEGDSDTDIVNNRNNEKENENKDIIFDPVENPSVVSTITESKDRSDFTAIEKEYFIKSDQHHNTAMKNRDGDIWITLRKAVLKEIDADLKAMMILRSQEVGLKVKRDDGDKEVSWQNNDYIDTAKNCMRLFMPLLMTLWDMKFTWNYPLWIDSN